MNESPLNWPRNYNPTPQIEGRRPGNLLPQKFNEWPAGRNRASNDAEELLSSAVAWWDASAYRSGDRFLRNLGVGGECLNLRLGSSILPNTNDPQYLAPEDSGYVYIPNTNGSDLMIPHSSSLSFSDDFEISARLFWNGGTGGILSKGAFANNQNYALYFNVGSFRLHIGNNTSNPGVQVPAGGSGVLRWYKVTVSKQDGSGNRTVRFWFAEDSEQEPPVYTQLGTDQTFSAIGSIATNTTEVYAGSVNGTLPLNGNIYRIIARNGINGQVVLDIDCNDLESSSQTNFTAKTGQVVHIRRPTTGRKSVAMPSKKNGGQPMFLFGTDDYLEVQGNEQHRLLNFGQDNNLSAIVVLRRWDTQANVSYIICKGSDLTNPINIGWGIRGNATDLQFENVDGINRAAVSRPVQSGALSIASCIKRSRNSRFIYINNALINQNTTAIGSQENTFSLSIGKVSIAPANFFEGELISVAIFRRDLTQQEITLLTNYYQNRKTFTYTIPSDNDQKAFMASRLGVSSSASALDILKDAPFYIDSRNFTAGSQYVQNLGWRRDALNIRLGSSGAVDTNDPAYLSPEQTGYVYLPGDIANRLSVASESAFNTTDLDVRVRVAMDDWTPSADVGLASRLGGDPNRSFLFQLLTNGRLRLVWCPTGSNSSAIVVTSSVAPTISDGATLWVRTTLDVDNGAAGYDVKFFTSADGSAWTQLGTTITGASTTSLPVISPPFEVSNSSAFVGRIYRAQLLSGIDGTTVLDIDCNSITSASASSFTALTGQTVSINRSTSGRKSVCIPSINNGGKPIWLFGTDDYMEIEGDVQNTLLNFTNGDSFTVLASMRQWPTISNPISVIAKKNTSIATTTPGYAIRASGVFSVADGKQNTSAIGSITNGIVMTTIGVRQGIVSQYVYSNNSQSSLPIISDFDSHINTDSLRIGSVFAGTQYADMEFIAAAIFRRALSASEISTLTTFFTS